MEEVYLVRHGSVENPEGVQYRRLPGFRLSERGIRESRQAAAFLSGRRMEAVFHSPLERCVQTASIIASALRVPMLESAEINEWDRNESLRDVQIRMTTFWMALHAQPYEKVVVVSHRDPLRVLMLSLSGRKLAEIYDPAVFALEPAGIWFARPGLDITAFADVFTPHAMP